MTVQVAAVIASILAHRWRNVGFEVSRFHLPLSIDLIARLAIWAAVLLSVVSAADYFVAFWNKIDRAAKSHQRSNGIAVQHEPPEVTAVRQ
jgi:hypothetical protein